VLYQLSYWDDRLLRLNDARRLRKPIAARRSRFGNPFIFFGFVVLAAPTACLARRYSKDSRAEIARLNDKYMYLNNYLESRDAAWDVPPMTQIPADQPFFGRPAARGALGRQPKKGD